MKNHNPLGVLTGSNPVHLAYFNSIDADIFKLKKHINKDGNFISKGLDLINGAISIPSGYSTIISESNYYYPALKKKLGLINSKIIQMNVTPIFYSLYSKRFSGITYRALKDLIKYVDGFLVQGTYGVELLEKLHIQKPYRVFYPFILEKDYSNLKNVKPNLNSHNITILVTGDYFCKGLDILLEAFERTLLKFPSLNLNIAGNVGLPLSHVKISKKALKNVKELGWINNKKDFFRNSSLYVHMGRGESFGVAILEALAAGLPTIVSTETGAKEVVGKVNRNFVVPLDSKVLADRIIKYFELSDSKKKVFSKKSREAAKPFQKKPMVKLFKKQFYSLSNEIL